MTPRIGLVARADNRGLGVMTHEFYRHMQPERTLVIAAGKFTPYEEHFDRYPDGRVAQWDGTTLAPEDVDWLLEGCDVLYTAETPYDYSLLETARRRGVATVVHGMWEFLRWSVDDSLPRPDLFLAPSTWCLDQWPPPTEHLPVPVATDRFAGRERTEVGQFLHIAGHRAFSDRNGTAAVLSALKHVRRPAPLVLRSQSRLAVPARVRGVKITVGHGDTTDYWRLYDQGDVLVAPRRYGGLSLPMNEAMAAGMAVVSTNIAPQKEFLHPAGLVAGPRRRLKAAAQTVEAIDADPRKLGAKLDELVATPELVAEMSRASLAYARSISWSTLLPRYRAVLAEVAGAFAR